VPGRAGSRFAGSAAGRGGAEGSGFAGSGFAGSGFAGSAAGRGGPEVLCEHSRLTCLSVTTCHALRRTSNYVVAATT